MFFFEIAKYIADIVIDVMHCLEDFRKYFFEIILTEMFSKISCYTVHRCFILISLQSRHCLEELSVGYCNRNSDSLYSII